MLELAKRVRFGQITINQLVGLAHLEQSMHVIGELLDQSLATKLIYLHDFFYVCPSLHLFRQEFAILWYSSATDVRGMCADEYEF